MDYDDSYDPHGDRDTDTSTPTGPPTFFVFAHYHYYPSGGMNDLHSSHHTIEAAREARDKALKDFDEADIAQFTDAGLVEVE